MNADFVLKLIVNPSFIIFISTFAGSIVGEFYREAFNGRPCNMTKFTANFLASWLMSSAAILLLKEVLGFRDNNEIIIALSMIYGFNGHKKTLAFVTEFIASNLNKK